MPRRKKLPNIDYEGGSKSALIQKSRPLLSLANSELSLAELKILDLYLSRINSHDSSKRTVHFEKGALEEALEVKQLKPDDIKKRLKNLFKTVEVADARYPEGFRLINLFETAEAHPDEDGIWDITLTCSETAREYIFNIENLTYLKYRLRNIINLTSRFSYVLFLYLVDNRFRKTWEIDLADLRQLLRCNSETYEQYYRFNDLILKKAHAEIIEKTDINFEYRPVKRGRSVKAVEFTYLSAVDLIDEAAKEPKTYRLPEHTASADDIPHTETASEHEERLLKMYGGEYGYMLAEACSFEFTPSEMGLLLYELNQRSYSPDVYTGREIDSKVSFLRSLYDRCNMMEEQGRIKQSKFAYLLSIVKNDVYGSDR